MLLPWMWLRKRKLEPLLKNYPLYDAPHKKEERGLPKAQAQENFDYFMRVREERAAYFAKWLKKNFGVTIEADERGVAALNWWVYKYGSLLLPSRKEQMGYFTYDPPWTGGCSGVQCCPRYRNYGRRIHHSELRKSVVGYGSDLRSSPK